MKKNNIAVVGGGVAGIVSSFLLQDAHSVTIFEKNNYLGGHTNTVVLSDGEDAGLAIDTGFIVLNDKNYPLMHSFLSRLKVPVRWSDMSFSFNCEQSNFYYAGTNIFGLFAQPKNIFSSRMWKLIFEIKDFCKEGLKELERGGLDSVTLGDYLKEKNYSEALARDYLLPMGGAIWSASYNDVLKFPLIAFLRFFKNHGLLTLADRPRWQTVVGGSQSYVKQFQKEFKGEVKLNSAVESVERTESGALVHCRDSSGEIVTQSFDTVVMACHADQTLRLLKNPNQNEKKLLGPWSYSKNKTVLHTDSSILPPSKRAWASWNYTKEIGALENEPASLTYYMNLLQGLKSKKEYCVSLNVKREIRESEVIREIMYTHPQYTFESMSTQAELSSLNDESNILFCGSYFGYGFHEDAIRSANDVGKKFGIEL